MQSSTSENLRIALDSVWSHRFRSGLTVLGIVIGITTVVTVSSLLAGVRQGVVTFFEEFGPDNVFLNRVSGPPLSEGLLKERKRRPLQLSYLDEVGRQAPSVMRTSVQLFIPPNFGGRPMIARSRGNESDRAQLVGISYSGFLTQPRDLSSGRLFSQGEATRAEKIAIIGFNVAEALFPNGRAVGQTFLMDGAEYRVIGVWEAAKGGFFGENQRDNEVQIPLETARARYPQADRYIMTFQAYPGLRDEALEEVRAILRRLRRVPAGVEDDFVLSTPDQIIARFDSLTGMIVMVSIAISAIGLLVGGIGVMNIMLVSVTERTREIGIRKAVGARRFDIITQFLMEAVTLAGLGGIIGIVFSVLVTLLIGGLLPSLRAPVPLGAIVAGVVVSVAVGLFFGVWPAVKASRLDPVEALRYE
jgi:putative ABC transport system permease protein